MVILGFTGANEMIGVTSFCRFRSVGNSLCMAFLNFFRASSRSLPAILAQWGTFVMTQEVAVLIQGRTVMIGDHTCVPKDGRRMPGAVSLHQNSETQSKPSCFRGHCRGAIAPVAGSAAAPYCLPLALAIRLGMLHIGQVQESGTGKRTENMGTRVVQTATDFALRHDAPGVGCIFSHRGSFQTGRFCPVHQYSAPPGNSGHQGKEKLCGIPKA